MKRALITLGLAILLGTSYITYENSIHEENRAIYIEGEFNQDLSATTVPLMFNFNKKPGLLIIDSLGGQVKDEEAIIHAMRDCGSSIDTYIPYMAASAAAQTWLKGVNRYVEPEAAVLFHGSSSGQGLTEPQLDKLLLNDPLNNRYLMMKSLLHIGNEAELDLWQPIIDASQGKLTREFIKDHFYHNFEFDIFVAGKELIELGIGKPATDIVYDIYK